MPRGLRTMSFFVFAFLLCSKPRGVVSGRAVAKLRGPGYSILELGVPRVRAAARSSVVFLNPRF
jgi:tryptophan synthase alpha subunit